MNTTKPFLFIIQVPIHSILNLSALNYYSLINTKIRPTWCTILFPNLTIYFSLTINLQIYNEIIVCTENLQEQLTVNSSFVLIGITIISNYNLFLILKENMNQSILLLKFILFYIILYLNTYYTLSAELNKRT